MIIDGLGAGPLPDAAQFGDQGCDHWNHLWTRFQELEKRTLRLPTLQSLGLHTLLHPNTGEITREPTPNSGFFFAGRAHEVSSGKDTSTGHWEMMGMKISTPFPTFPNGFPQAWIDEFCKKARIPGVLGNRPASGTTILEELADEHIHSGKPIVYTSGDSVWQIAAHETHFGLEKLLTCCKIAREICDREHISRVIARPFIGESGNWKRTYNRKDLSLLPPQRSFLEGLQEAQIPTLGIGKISSIFANKGIDHNWDSKGNTHGLELLDQAVETQKNGLLFINLIDTDMLYGHRRDSQGYGFALEEIDVALGKMIPKLTPDDLLIISSDHGNDPTFPGSDHTREFVPLLGYTPIDGARFQSLVERTSFADIGASIYTALTGQDYNTWKKSQNLIGTSIWPELGINIQ